MFQYFIKPSAELYLNWQTKEAWYKNYKTYSEYNYLRKGIISKIKLYHFEVALKLTKRYFNNCNVIDFGCSDGIFLLSLSKYFNYVVGVDISSDAIKLCEILIKEYNLRNTSVICNNKLPFQSLKKLVPVKEYKLLYLLEVMEHVGESNDLYNSKMSFLINMFKLVQDDGIIVISVPIMTGIRYLIERIGLILFNMSREHISFGDLIRACFFNNTDRLEKFWTGGHVGFNHLKFEKYLRKNFRIIKRRYLMFQVFYVIQSKVVC